MTINKLFIYIPTYNRPNALANQLALLMPQVLGHADQVRLLICDNDSSGPQYGELVNKYRDASNIVFRKNAGNIGANANIALGFIFVEEGEFLWILSDNDIVSADAVSYILSQLDDQIDFYCFNDAVTEPTIVDHDWKDGWDAPMEWRMGLISDGLYTPGQSKAPQKMLFIITTHPFLIWRSAVRPRRRKGL